MKEKGMNDVLLTGGGIIPADDMKHLNELGVGKLFPPGTSTSDIAELHKKMGKRKQGFLNSSQLALKRLIWITKH